jgi:hypothetical protein
MELGDLKNLIQFEAKEAATKYLNEVLEGKDRPMCGFAWVKVIPTHKGNTKLGRTERATLQALGFEKTWDGKAYELYMPGRINAQNVNVHLAGAEVAATIFRPLRKAASTDK